MLSVAAPVASVCAAAICEPSGLINVTFAPAPKAPNAGTTLMLLTVGVTTGGVTTGGVTTGGVTTGGVVLLEEPPPQPANNAKGKIKHERNL
jgi:hypothetical protein